MGTAQHKVSGIYVGNMGQCSTKPKMSSVMPAPLNSSHKWIDMYQKPLPNKTKKYERRTRSQIIYSLFNF
jgi:hypothetical protein